MPTLSSRISEIKASVIVEIGNKTRELKKAGRDIISFGIGVPNFLPPQHVYDAAHKAIDNDTGNYLSNQGTPELIDAFIYRLKEDGFNFKPEEVCVSVGAKNGLHALFTCMLNDGEEVIFPAPYWTSYIESIEMSRGVPKAIYCGSEQNYKLTPEQLEAAITPKTKIFLFNNPNNPTGMVYTEAEVKALGDVLEKHDIWIISDDIYDKFLFDGAKFHHLMKTNPALKDRTMVVQSVSKTFGMPGWRIGIVAGNTQVINMIKTIAANVYMNVSGVPMAAAAAAFRGDYTFLDNHVKTFHDKRDVSLKTLNKIDGLECPIPQGAFYVFPNVSAYFGKKFRGEKIKSSTHLCELLLEHKNLALVPGEAFGDPKGLRISYSCSEENLRLGLKAFQEFFAECE